MADGDEDAFDLGLGFFASDEIFQQDGAHLALLVGEVGGDARVPYRLDLRIGEGAVGHDFRGAELVPPMDEVHFASKAGEEARFFAGAIASADDGDGNAGVEGTIAGGTRGESATDELLFIGQAEVAWGGTGGDDHGARCVVGGRSSHREGAIRLLGYRLDLLVLDAGAKFFGLPQHAAHEFWSHDAFWVTGEIFHLGGGGKLPAGLHAGEHEGIEVGSGGVNGCGVARASGADNDNIFHGGRSLHDGTRLSNHLPFVWMGWMSFLENPVGSVTYRQ